MTALTEGFQIVVTAIFRSVVKVCNRKDYLYAGDRVRLSIQGAAKLTTPPGPLADPRGDPFPVLRIPPLILRPDRHFSSNL